MNAPRRLIVGNLDFEVVLASATSTSPQLKQAVVERISAAAATLSVFGCDALWTPRPVDGARLTMADPPELLSGPLAAVGAAGAELLAWGETPAVAALRGAERPAAVAGDWTELLWQLHPTAECARRCNQKRTAFELTGGLPGARLVTSIAELEAHLAGGGAALAGDSWVVKAQLSAAGRDRLRQRGDRLSPPVQARIERLLARGPVLFEPWVDRLVDVGTVGVVTADRPVLLPPHRLRCDAAGVFRGIEVGGELGLTADETDQLAAAADRAAAALAAAGYRGPFGIDAYAYRDHAGQRGFQPMSEINARLSFGHVAHAHARDRDQPLGFELGANPPANAELLVVPAAPDRTGAWLTRPAAC